MLISHSSAVPLVFPPAQSNGRSSFRGRVIKLPGDRTFESWTITVMADEEWQSDILWEVDGETEQAWERCRLHREFCTLKVSHWHAELLLPLLLDPHSVVRSYDFFNAFPTNIAQIDLSYDNNNTIAEYTVEFSMTGGKLKADDSIDLVLALLSDLDK